MCNKPQETKAEPPPAAPAHGEFWITDKTLLSFFFSLCLACKTPQTHLLFTPLIQNIVIRPINLEMNKNGFKKEN